MLDSVVLTQFCQQFFGYGELTAPIWFIGMEEGGAKNEQEIVNRLTTWAGEVHQQPVLADLREFHVDFGDDSRFVDGAAIQSTWKLLMLVMLRIQGQINDATGNAEATELIRQYQMHEFGRIGSGTAILELMPLPSRGLNEWKYDEWTCPVEMPHLQTRPLYMNRVCPQRIEQIRALILERKPQAVIFYGSKYQTYWEAISGAQFGRGAYPRLAQTANTVFLSLPHPTARGNIKEIYVAAANLLIEMGIPHVPPNDELVGGEQ